MKVSIAQLDSTDDVERNLARIEEMAATAAGQDADLVVFPEFAMYDLPQPDHRFVEVAEPLDGPFTQALRRTAARHGVAIVAGMLESIEGEDRAHNTLYVAGPNGEYLAHYRKVHLYDAFMAKESDLIRPSEADGPVLFEVAGTTVGLSTCYDIRFPESSRELAAAGADLIVLAASWVPGPRKEDHLHVLGRARAIENTVYFLTACQAPPISTGGSVLLDPMGVVVGELGEKPEVRTFEVDKERIAAVRRVNPCLTDRRFEVRRLATAGVVD
ncbi:carbon-nitrogen hydrolase family protein [Arthrobacter ginkgonis]|uniref:Carbon-nitrogen hydrolase family protein n=1 Tax=Arthrobacter ginkgonis TaxID=1630594 RepID=A0ABP7BS16_9MICC